jgi:hypothetical protein
MKTYVYQLQKQKFSQSARAKLALEELIKSEVRIRTAESNLGNS